jgi:hypothetical protein
VDDEFLISYEGVSLGVPVLTSDGEQFGILEHVLAVAEEDIFEGIVVWTGGGTWADRHIQRDLSRGHTAAARILEALQPDHLRFVHADKIKAITVGYIRCDFGRDAVGLLPRPQGGAQVYYANAIDQANRNVLYGGIFGRGRWRRE